MAAEGEELGSPAPAQPPAPKRRKIEPSRRYQPLRVFSRPFQFCSLGLLPASNSPIWWMFCLISHGRAAPSFNFETTHRGSDLGCSGRASSGQCGVSTDVGFFLLKIPL